MTKLMDLSIEKSSHSAVALRLILAATILIGFSSVGRAQGPLDPRLKSNEPVQNLPGPTRNQPAAKQDLSGDQQPTASVNRLTRDEAVRLALAQASAFQTAQYAELIASEDVRQARAAFLPRISIPST
ncbi:MAG: hypothetical protein WAV20_00045, partial [Blastocatellia bacterium]